MTQNQTTLSLIEKIAGSNKYVKIIENMTDKIAVWHSETGKNTCENCKSLDNVKFYPGDKMPVPPLHPNCKCEIKFIEMKNTSSNYDYCDCLDRIQKIRENISKLISNINLFLKNNIQNESEDFSHNVQIIKELLKELNKEYNLTKDEIGKHQPNCSIKPDEMCKNLYQKIQELKQIQDKYVNDSNSLFGIKSSMEELKKYLKKDLTFEADVLLDNRENSLHHQKNECEFENRINAINKVISEISAKVASEYQKNNNIKTFRNTLNDKLLTIRNLINENERKRQVKCDCKNSGQIRKTKEEQKLENKSKLGYGMTLAGANLNDAMNDFAAAKKNEYATVYDSKEEILDKAVYDVLNSLKKPENSKMVVYDIRSRQSLKLYKQKEVQDFIKNHYQELKRGNYQNKIVDIQFTNDVDAYLALQHCKLVNPIITYNGYFQATIVDYYDFDHREGGSRLKQKAAKEINNWGHSMQEKGYLENFFVVY